MEEKREKRKKMKRGGEEKRRKEEKEGTFISGGIKSSSFRLLGGHEISDHLLQRSDPTNRKMIRTN